MIYLVTPILTCFYHSILSKIGNICFIYSSKHTNTCTKNSNKNAFINFLLAKHHQKLVFKSHLSTQFPYWSLTKKSMLAVSQQVTVSISDGPRVAIFHMQYLRSPHGTEKWETENSVLCKTETVLI